MADKKQGERPHDVENTQRMPFDDALRKMLGTPPAPKVKPKLKKEKKTGS